MKNDNTRIWDALYTSDPKHVKAITGKSYHGSSPKPHWVIKRLTEQFGPVGKGFGWNVLHSVYIDSIPRPDGVEKRHECRIRFWWRDEAGVHEVESEGGTKSLYKAKAGADGKSGYWVDDEDAAKKSLTDAVTKAASWLGVAGDIFMGQWDDSKYVASLREEARKAAESPAQGGQANTVADPTIRATNGAEPPRDDFKPGGRFGIVPGADSAPLPPHDPETGEIADPMAVQDTDSGNLMAWKDIALNNLGATATDREKSAAYTDQIIADLKRKGYKSVGGLNGYLMPRNGIIAHICDNHADFGELLTATIAWATEVAKGRTADAGDFERAGAEPVILGDMRVPT